MFSWQCLLDLDNRISSVLAYLHSLGFVVFAHRLEVRFTCLLLEWAVHGIPWIIGTCSLLAWAHLRKWPAYKIQPIFVLLIGLSIDLALVGFFKIAVRRQRPEYNLDDQLYEAPIADQFSFPSGHSSRAAMLSTLSFILGFADIGRLGIPPFTGAFLLIAFPPILAISRVLMGRHFVLDAVAGLLLGIAEGFIALRIANAAWKLNPR